jgi:hypothetical protein
MSSQVNVPVFIASEKVNKNLPIVQVVSALCPSARVIVACGLVASKLQTIGQKGDPDLAFHVQFVISVMSAAKFSLYIHLLTQVY